MRFLLFGMFCAVAMGCNENSSLAPGTQSSTDRPTTVTANRPIVTESPDATVAPIDPANTGVNIRDRESTTKTPFDQNENKSDIAITANIRKQVVGTKMSVDAQNVKIMTQDGKVTLRGPVKTEQEKLEIEKIATDVAGANQVDSQLEVSSQ